MKNTMLGTMELGREGDMVPAKEFEDYWKRENIRVS